MPPPVKELTLKDRIRERKKGLQGQRVDLVQRHAGELKAVDTQIAACDALLASWLNLSMDDALRLLKDAGLPVSVG